MIALLLATLPYWQDVQTTSVNAQTRRNEVIYYASREDALGKGFRESENYLDLNGVWDFKYFDDFSLDAQVDSWDKIKVPGNWESQGWGIPIYCNQPYDFMPVNPQPPTLPEKIPGGIYRRSFSVPGGWASREVFLNLAGPRGGIYVYVNGQEIGYSEDSKSLARFRITDAIHEGSNELVLKLFRYDTGSYLEDQDFWSLSGMERDVYLSSEKSLSGFDFSVISTLDKDLKTGLFKLKMSSDAPVDIFYELLDKDGSAVADASFRFDGSMSSVTDTVKNVRKWTAETPELYTLLLRVNGEYTRFHVGFRRIEIATVKDGERDVKALLVNGQPVKFKGVNLHEHNPYTGHYTDRQNILEDLMLMRKANINAIRTCHYPQPREFYELCDSLGFYVYDEANVESHGMGYHLSRTLGNNPEWYAKHIDRILNMYRRTANYPCVTILSLGNEAGNGVNFYNAYRELKALEKDGMNRPVVYERAEYEWNTDMIVPQYPGANWFKAMGEHYGDRPVCPSEYAHAMGNSTGSLDWQWNQIYAHTHLQGGFIWDWVDQGLYDKDRVWTYGGDYGENMPTDYNFCCNGIVNPDREPHPGYYEVKHVYQEVSVSHLGGGLFQAFNRYYFKSLKGLTLRWWMERNGKRIFCKKGKIKLTAEAQQAQEFKLRLPRMRKGGEYRVFFEVLSGADVIANDEVLLGITPRKAKAPAKGNVEIKELDTRILVSAGKMELAFDKIEGKILSYRMKGKDIVDPEFGIRPNFWRPLNDNDLGNWLPGRAIAWRKGASAVSTKVEEDSFTATYALPGETFMKVRFTPSADGSLHIESEFKGSDKAVTDLPRLGWRMRVQESDFSYFGRGPVENYWDRSSCTFKRIWKSNASKEFYPYVRPQETGHHTDASWLRIGSLEAVQGAEPFEFNVLRLRIEDLECEDYNNRQYHHLGDIRENNFTEVCLDYRMSGIGGYDSWGSRPETERCLWTNRDYTWDITLKVK